MRLFLHYLRSRIWAILLLTLLGGISIACTVLYGLPLGAILYPPLLGLLMIVGFGTVDFLRCRKRILELSKLHADDPCIPDLLVESSNPEVAVYQQLVTALCRQNQAEKQRQEERYQQMTAYYSVWAHQIKTPIAAMRLLLEGEDSVLSRQLSAQVLSVEQYVSLVMAFLRLESPSTDYVFRQTTLDAVLRPCLRQMVPMFIAKSLTLQYETCECSLVTDEKWLRLVIEQILSNALKYTQHGSIRIYCPQDSVLCIADTGMGIAQEDLPRIFEQGFTGLNGRSGHGASGLGLYLCKRICSELNVDISVQSELGKGTQVFLRFLTKL